MRTLSAELLSLIVIFQPLFTKPTWERAKLLLLGALLQRGKRTVTACLRVVGLSQEGHFQNYHRVLNRASWSAIAVARILLGLIILIFPPDGTIVFAADDTIERRRGKKISKLSCHRDPVRSTRKQTIKCFGLKWLSMAILVKLPWSSQVYALPFLTALCAPQLEGQPVHTENPVRLLYACTYEIYSLILPTDFANLGFVILLLFYGSLPSSLFPCTLLLCASP